jgi:hypothetical protein
MPAKNPRINVVLERSSFEAVKEMSEREGISLSAVTGDLVKEALELREDDALAAWGEERLKSYDPSKAVDHKDAWKKR